MLWQPPKLWVRRSSMEKTESNMAEEWTRKRWTSNKRNGWRSPSGHRQKENFQPKDPLTPKSATLQCEGPSRVDRAAHICPRSIMEHRYITHWSSGPAKISSDHILTDLTNCLLWQTLHLFISTPPPHRPQTANLCWTSIFLISSGLLALGFFLPCMVFCRDYHEGTWSCKCSFTLPKKHKHRGLDEKSKGQNTSLID